ncbi:MAG: hypothetical protein K8H90_08870, partial [Thermoanaerobaculia bacterium]|nr:hypothetical protein [Thermoanaerobaculia bacterium]
SADQQRGAEQPRDAPRHRAAAGPLADRFLWPQRYGVWLDLVHDASGFSKATFDVDGRSALLRVGDR